MNKKDKIINQEMTKAVVESSTRARFGGEKGTKATPNEDKMTLEELVLFVKQIKEGKVEKETYQEFLQELNIKTYLPLEKKSQLMTSLVLNLVYTPDFISELAAIDLEFRKFFYCLLAYTDIEETSIGKYPLEFETYDLFIETGVYDDIYSVCKKDYERLEKMIDHAMSFSTMLQVVSNMGQIDTESMGAQIKEAQVFINSMSKEDKELLATIGTVGDPLVADIAKLVRENKLK